MVKEDFILVRAIHPHWVGFLKLSCSDNVAEHFGTNNKARFDLSDDKLTVYWEQYEPDLFIHVANVFVHKTLLHNIMSIDKLFAVSIGNEILPLGKISVKLLDNNYEILLRLHTTDIAIFDQVFSRYEYDSPNLPNVADVIIDLGANIGLASIFFSLKYPNAKIISVEPEESNFGMLTSNTAALGAKVTRLHAAVWIQDGSVNLHTEDANGLPLGSWGVQVSDRVAEAQRATKCFKLATLLDEMGVDSVDILKIDIEGAELELFSAEAVEWLPRVKLIVVETHDRFRPGSDAAVRNAVQPMFEELPCFGENLFFRRKANNLISSINGNDPGLLNKASNRRSARQPALCPSVK